ncbi:hypothetical protein JTB14_011266 [Gonioctena quinquepunctata]|nr:hypothetical protein JTB14_011266 [Gonioctena quinquepunctata]
MSPIIRISGELEKILIEDYRNYKFLDDDGVFKNLEEKMRNLEQKYARFFIRGKLNQKVPVLISREHIDSIELILEYREQYGASPNNPYVFGTVGKQCFLRACNLLRYYSLRCGAPNPKRLRETELGKQIATACKMYNLPDLLIKDVANHLGHDISIHKSIYRQSLGT